MRKKDFEGIAEALRFEPMSHPASERTRVNACVRLGAFLATRNPRFDRARFLDACGIPNTSGKTCPECRALINDYYRSCSNPKCEYTA